jgi:hypothetical protein
MVCHDPTAIQRRAARRDWRVVKTSLSASIDAGSLPPEVALGMMWQLALDAWAMTGRAIPDYSRTDSPVRRLRMPQTQMEREG